VPSIASLTRAKAMPQHDRTHTHVILQSFWLSQDLCCTFAAANTRHPTASCQPTVPWSVWCMRCEYLTVVSVWTILDTTHDTRVT
jgi:hypothetical protein